MASTVMPLINDAEVSIDAIAQAAARAGATNFWSNILFLKPCSKQVFLPFIEERFPSLLRRYKERYGRAAYLRGAYPDLIHARVQQIRKRYGFDQRDPARDIEPELWPQPAQLELFTSNQL